MEDTTTTINVNYLLLLILAIFTIYSLTLIKFGMVLEYKQIYDDIIISPVEKFPVKQDNKYLCNPTIKNCTQDLYSLLPNVITLQQGEIMSLAITTCQNKDTLKETVFCLEYRFILPLFNYSSTIDGTKLTLAQLYTQGGDCEQWSEMWIYLLNEIGYKGKTIKFTTGNNSAHMIGIAYGDKEYCILDQTKTMCTTLK